MPKRIIVGSESPIKLEAVQDALNALKLQINDIVGIKTNSGVPEQPFGFVNGWKGARNRVQEAIRKFTEKTGDGDWFLGIENMIYAGPVQDSCGAQYNDLACITLKPGPFCADNHLIYEAMSASVQIPREFVEKSRESQWGITAAEFMSAEHPEMNPKDPHLWITHGVVSRQKILSDVLEILFASTFGIR